MRLSLAAPVFTALAALSFLVPAPLRAAGASAVQTEAGQKAHTFEGKVDGKEATLGYLLFLPESYAKEKDKKWPVMLFLHGSGERGNGKDEIDRVKKHGPAKIVEEKKDFPFIVISPQCPEKQGWDADVLEALLKDVLDHYRTDANRVYLTGLSMGGFGTWDLAAKHPEQFAAIAPVCGGVWSGKPMAANGAKTPAAERVAQVAEKVKDLPIWDFHGEKDTSVPIAKSEEIIAALKKAGAKDVQFTRYPDKGHDCWTVTYDNPKLYDWMLSHKRGEKAKVD